IVKDSASAPIAERAWARAGDVYFQAERYADAKRCYHGLLEHFAGSPAAALATLRLAQCEYNGGHDADALALFSQCRQQFPCTPMRSRAASAPMTRGSRTSSSSRSSPPASWAPPCGSGSA